MSCFFADVIGNTACTGPLVRVDFISLQPPTSRQQEIKHQHSHCRVRLLDGFLRSLDVQFKLRDQLLKDDLIASNS